MFASGLIDTIYRNVYLLVIGRFFSAADLGYYTRADSFKKMPSQNITDVIQRVSYPALSLLQDDTPRLRRAYQKLIKSAMLITFTLMLGMAAVAEPLILTLIGEQWQPSIIYLQLLCFVGMFYPLQAINLNMLKVKGRSDLFLNLEIVKKSLAVPAIIIGIYLGIEAMLVGMIVNGIIAYYINSYWSGKLIGYSTKQQVKDILPSFTLAAVVSGIVYLVGYLIPYPPPHQLVLQLALGGCLTIGMAELLRLDNYLDMKLIILEKLFKRTPAP
jgi:O-antigen/teichoic acid export membrane protein